MIIIKIDSKGPIFYTQERCGKNKKYFNIIKFRSMILLMQKINGQFGQISKIKGLLEWASF